jgi:Fe-S oxidoreductase
MQRVQEAAKTGAEIMAISCPLEVPRFEDAIKTSGLEGRFEVREISHMVAEAMGLIGGV